METASRRRGRGPVHMKSTCAEAREASLTPPTPYLELQGLAALRRTCRPCLALPPSSGFWPKSLWQLWPLLANLANTFHLLHCHRQEFHPSISCIASPSLHLALYTRAPSLSAASAL